MSELTDEIKRIAAMPSCHADTRRILEKAIYVESGEKPACPQREGVKCLWPDCLSIGCLMP